MERGRMGEQVEKIGDSGCSEWALSSRLFLPFSRYRTDARVAAAASVGRAASMASRKAVPNMEKETKGKMKSESG